MAKVGTMEAARLAGVAKSTLQRAVLTGRLSAEVDEHGRRCFDVAELERVFGHLNEPASPAREPGRRAQASPPASPGEPGLVHELRAQVERLRADLEDERRERREWERRYTGIVDQYTRLLAAPERRPDEPRTAQDGPPKPNKTSHRPPWFSEPRTAGELPDPVFRMLARMLGGRGN